MLRNLAESLCNILLIRSHDHTGLPNHLEVSDHRHVVTKEASLKIANERLRDSFIDELRNREKYRSSAHVKSKAWKDATTKKKVVEEVGNKTLTDNFRDRFFIKRSSRGYEKNRRDVSNGHASHNRGQPPEGIEVN